MTLRSIANLSGHLAILSLLAAGVPLLSGCGAGAPDAEGTDTRDEGINAQYGVDYAWWQPSPSALKSQGYTFVARYLSYDPSKNISLGEAHELEKAGLSIVLNWEWNATDALDGYGRGVEQAKAAEGQAKAVGQPPGRPIYFSLDFDAAPGDQGAIDSYFDGVASVIGRDRTGAYGGYYPITRLFDHGKIKWAWQTYAWSGGQWDSRAQFRQTLNGIEGGNADKDEAVVADFGQWGQGAAPPPPAPHGGSGSLGGNVEAAPAVCPNDDGRLEVFATGANGALWTTFQTAPNSGWSAWFSLGGNLQGRPAALNNSDGRIEVFARGSGGDLQHAWQDAPNGKIAGLVSLGGSWTSDPAATRNQDGRLEVFMAASDGSVQHAWQHKPSGSWSAWATLGSAGGGFTQPRALLGHDGGLWVFGVGKDGATYVTHQGPNGWTAWESLGGDSTSNVTVGENEDGRLEAFVRGTDGALWHAWEKSPGGAWTGWASLGGGIHAPIAARDADGRLEVFARGDGAGALYRISQKSPGSSWTGWDGMGGQMTFGAAAARNKDGRLEVFYRATNGSVEHAWEAAPETW